MSAPVAATRSAPAKVNLLLRILGSRSDGFHDLETLFQAVTLHDDVTVELSGRGGVEIEVEGADVGPAVSNLAYRAADSVLRAAGSREGVRVRLTKRIPAGAGLGGGSSDAAAALMCANRVLGVPLDGETLRTLAAGLGSDVPFFLGSSTLARGSGRGEILEGLPPLPVAHLVLVLPPVGVATGWAYGALDEWRRENRRVSHPGPGGKAPSGWADVKALAGNDFEVVVAAVHPEVARSLAALRGEDAAPVLLSGSGAACFGVFPDAHAAEVAAASVGRRLGWPAVMVSTLREWPPLEVHWPRCSGTRS